MKKNIVLISLIIITSMFVGCDVASDGNDSGGDNGSMDQVLSGKIEGQSFNFVSGVAKSKNDSWSIELHKIKPASGVDPWDYSAYQNSYPYLVFKILKVSEAKKYSISTFGTSGLMLTGWTSVSGGVFFDKGEIEILSISSTEITGTIAGETTDKNSKLYGKFTVVVQQ